ncbi:hypothetical protein NMY22_g17663 [Coprinellus aureogranulatus]|nr:hypothetical protein NMY22_g17663 [Coprinellus aureogranulatus]
MATFFSLPNELLFRTMAELEPLDLIHLSQVCRKISQVVSQRSVWEKVFQAVCQKARIFRPSFHPVDTLSIDTLRKGSLKPTILAQTLTSDWGILPAKETVLELNSLFEERMRHLAVHLVPGGRYVIGATERCLSLWDLGLPGNLPHDHSSAITSLLGYYIPDLPTLRYWFISAPVPHSSDYLRFFALVWETRMPGPVSITKIHVYEVGPLPANDSLRLIAELKVGFAASLAFHGWISKDRMYLHVKGRIIIWDFVASLVVSLDDVPVETDYGDSEVMTIGEKFVLLLTHGIYSWDIPSLQTVEKHFVWESWNQSAEDWRRAAAVSTASYSRFLNDEPSSPGGRCILFEPSRWHSDGESGAHLVFTIAEYSQTDENRALTGQLRVRVEIIDGFPQAIVTSKSLPSRALASLLLRQSYMNCNRQYSLCGDRMFATTGFEMRHEARSTTDSEEISVETLLFNAEEKVSSESTHTLAPPTARAPALRARRRLKWYDAWPLKVLFFATFVLLLLVLSLFFAVFIWSHSIENQYIKSLPSYCGLPGMEPYRLTSHCRPPHAPSNPFGLVKPGTALLDGPPPKPIHTANFQKLYDLQCRMIEHLVDAAISEGAITLGLIADESKDKESPLYQLDVAVERRDPKKGRVLREILFNGGELGRELATLYESTWLATVGLLSHTRRVSEGIEKSELDQPKSILAQLFAPLVPRSHHIFVWPWPWPTDIELRWRFYDSLTFFSNKLYRMLLKLNELELRIGEYGKDLSFLQSMLAEKKEEPAPTPPATPPVATSTTKTGLLAALFKTSHPEKDIPPEPSVAPERKADEEYELLKEAALNRLVQGRQAALERVGAALTALRGLSEELEGLRHKVAEPAPPMLLWDHLKEVYFMEERLRQKLKGFEAFEEEQKRAEGRGS